MRPDRVLLLLFVATGCAVVPGEPVLSIEPAEPRTDDPLILAFAVPAGRSAEEVAAWAVAWTRDGVDVPDVTGRTVHPNQTTRGQTWSATLWGDGESWVSPEVVIRNTAPSATSATLGPDAPGSDDPIVVSVLGWADPDGDPPAFTVAWRIDGLAVPGQVGMTLPAGLAQRGSVVEATVTPWDGLEEGVPLIAGPVSPGNGAPVVSSVAIVPLAPTAAADDLRCLVDVSDPDGDTIEVRIDWTVDDLAYPSLGGPWTGPGTTQWPGDTVPAADPGAGQRWTCTATAGDGLLTSPPRSASALVSAGPAPDFELVDVNPTSPRSGQVVSPRDYLEKVSGWYFGHAT